MKTSKMMKTFFIMGATMALLLGACGKKDQGQTGSEELPSLGERYEIDKSKPAWELDSKEEPTKLTWYVNADWWNKDFGNDVVTKKIQEDLNVDITFITGDDTRLNTIFAGGEMPDMITIFDGNSKVAQKAESWAWPLDDLIDKYDPYFYEVASEDTLNWYQLDDGKTYGYPAYSNTAKDYEDGLIKPTTAFVIRQDVYKDLNEPKFSTPEEFLASLREIKKAYPDMTPFGFNSMTTSTGSLGNALQDMLGVPLETETGEFYNRNLDEEYLSWLKVLNQAYQEGLISDDSFADDQTGFEEKVKVGKYAIMFVDGTPQLNSSFQTFLTDNPGKEYIAVDSFESSTGNQPTLSQAGISGWMINYVTKACADPVKAIQIFTYLQSKEGEILTSYGVEGVTYQVTDDGKFELLPEVKEMKENNPDQYKKEYRLGEFAFFGHDSYSALGAGTQAPAIKQMQDWGDGLLYPHFVLENTSPDTGTTEARNLAAINTRWNTTLVNMLRAKNDKAFDSAKEDYEAFLKQNDWDAIQKVYTEKMEDNRKKLDMK